MHTAMARVTATFTIEARDAMGSPQQSGGEIFMVSVRGSSRVTAKVYDNEDGTYRAGRLPSATHLTAHMRLSPVHDPACERTMRGVCDF